MVNSVKSFRGSKFIRVSKAPRAALKRQYHPCVCAKTVTAGLYAKPSWAQLHRYGYAKLPRLVWPQGTGSLATSVQNTSVTSSSPIYVW